MANRGGGQNNRYGNIANRSFQNHHIPRMRLRNYKGPYDPAALFRARDELQSCVQNMRHTYIWRRIGDSDDGFGEASNSYSHTEPPEDRKKKDIYQGHYPELPIKTTPGTELGSLVIAPADSVTAACTSENPNVMNMINDNGSSNGDATQEKYSRQGRDKRNETGQLVNVKIETSVLVNEENESIEIHADKNYNADDRDSSRLIVDENEMKLVNRNVTIKSECAEFVPGSGLNIYNVSNCSKIIQANFSNNQDLQSTVAAEMKLELEDQIIPNECIPEIMTCNEIVLKCDFCEFTSVDKGNVQTHLDSAVHYAASEYFINEERGRIELLNKMVLKNMCAKFKTVLAVCTQLSCQKLFPDIHECSNHIHQKHKKRKFKMFGLFDVEKEEECINAISPPICYACMEQFNTPSELKKHIKTKLHYPYTEMKKCRHVFLCRYCEKGFKLLDAVIDHQLFSHGNKAVNGILRFTAFHYKYKTLKKHALNVYKPSSLAKRSAKRKHDGKCSGNEQDAKKRKTSVSSTPARDSDNKPVSGSQHATCISHDNSSRCNVISKAVEKDKTGVEMSKAVEKDKKESVQKGHSNDTMDILETMFKCDYCFELHDNRQDMLSHLTEAEHSAASSVLTDDHQTVKYINYRKAVLHEASLGKKISAVCPGNCFLLFDCIYKSAKHYNKCSSNRAVGLSYGLVDIVDRLCLEVPVDTNVCSVCTASFPSEKQFTKHLQSSRHFPFKERSDCTIYTQCRYCKKFRVFQHYMQAYEHTKMKHREQIAKNGMFEMIILFADKNTKKYTLPLYLPRKTMKKQKQRKESRR